MLRFRGADLGPSWSLHAVWLSLCHLMFLGLSFLICWWPYDNISSWHSITFWGLNEVTYTEICSYRNDGFPRQNHIVKWSSSHIHTNVSTEKIRSDFHREFQTDKPTSLHFCLWLQNTYTTVHTRYFSVPINCTWLLSVLHVHIYTVCLFLMFWLLPHMAKTPKQTKNTMDFF